jgi:hypothetical protein
MLGREILVCCSAALLLWTASFAQPRHTQPQRSAPSHPQQHSHPHPQKPHQQPQRPRQAPNESRPQNQPGHAGNWLRQYRDLPTAQQRRSLESDPQFRRLSPQQQARLQQRLQHFSGLPRDQQERVLNRMETWEHLTSDQKERARQLFNQFKQLSPDRRQAVNRAIRDMRGLTPDQRDQLINSDQYAHTFSLQERVILSGAAHLPLAPGDGLQSGPPE